jgi:hypothetical protein
MAQERIEVLDFSSAYFVAIRGYELPPQRGGKFIVIEHDGVAKVVLSPTELSFYHANILERYCAGYGIEVAFNAKRDAAAVIGEDLEVLGGGFWLVDELGNRLYLWGKSQAYGSFDGVELARRGLDCVHELVLEPAPVDLTSGSGRSI